MRGGVKSPIFGINKSRICVDGVLVVVFVVGGGDGGFVDGGGETIVVGSSAANAGLLARWNTYVTLMRFRGLACLCCIPSACLTANFMQGNTSADCHAILH